MNKKRLGILCSSVLLLGLASTAQATLFDRGGGMIYDSDQNLTWLQDANYAATSGYAAANAVYNGATASNNIFADGVMGWDAAVAWASGLSVGGYTDWRLPTITDNGNDGCNFGFTGTDCGYNIDTSGSELGYMWYNILGNIAYYDTSGNGPQAGWGLTSTGADGVNFLNLQSYYYWSGTEYALATRNAWNFRSSSGRQFSSNKSSVFYAWAVRSGDVGGGGGGTVPEPGTLLLMGLGLAGLVVRRRCLQEGRYAV